MTVSLQHKQSVAEYLDSVTLLHSNKFQTPKLRWQIQVK